MPTKTIQQQPVTLDHLNQVTYILYPTGGVDANYLYTPVDETGAQIDERRSLTESKAGAEAQAIKDWITTNVLPEINAYENT